MPEALQAVVAGQAPAPSPPPAPATITKTPPGAYVPQVPEPITLTSNSPSAIYEAMRNQRRELINQLERLNDQRSDLAGELNQARTRGMNPGGLEARLKAADERIAGVENQLAQADAAVARAAAVPGAVVPPTPRAPRPGPPEEFYVLVGIFMFIVVLPLTIAYARRIWRRGAVAVTQFPQELYERFTRLEQSVDSIAIEVERVGEGQRYLTKVYTDRGLGTGGAQPVETPARLEERQSR